MSPLPHRPRRIGIWTSAEEPPRAADGQTMIAVLDPDRLGGLDGPIALQDIAEVVTDIESLVWEHIFWLDGGYPCAMAPKQPDELSRTRPVMG